VVVSLALPFLTPVIIAALLAAMFQPVVEWLGRHRVRRTAASALCALAVPLLLAVFGVTVALALRGHAGEWQHAMREAARRVQQASGGDPVTPVLDAVQKRAALLGIAGLVGNATVALIALILGVLLAVYITFFLLKDAPRFGTALYSRLALPLPLSRKLISDAAVRLRQYLVGTTVVAAMDMVAITLGAAVLRVPMLGIIALVTFVTAYVPYLGAWIAAIFTVLVALGTGGVSTALWMLLVVLVTQNLLEGLARPFVFGAALDMHPLALMAITLVGGAVGGALGVFVAPPLVAIALSWSKTLRAADIGAARE
jgi:predicted PurR-regulated permease PerM